MLKMAIFHGIMALAGLINFFMPVSMAIDPNCDYYQDMNLGQEYYINNIGYPQFYSGEQSCRYMANSPIGTKIVISCELQLPSTYNCNGDRLSISLSGNANFLDSRNYCGVGSVSFVSDANSIAVGLFTQRNTNGGNFLCTLTPIQDGPTTSTTARPNVCDCGWKQTIRIVGGHETGVNEFPSMAGLVDTSLEGQVYCGGSIISEKYVLTAAHCLFRRDPNNVAVLVGDHNVSTGADTPYSRLLASLRFIIHENYNSQTQVNDIGIIQTVRVIEFNLYVGPVCLPFRYSTYSFEGEMVTALGWGQTEYNGPQSSTLQEVDLQVVNTYTCAQELSENVITNNQICTFAKGKDACQSDSGGPILWWNNNIRRLVLPGIISYGVACATDLPGVNTRVTSYLTWIVSKTNDVNYCIK